jgi:tetratricopeptide (TPR) repeat protein
VPRKDASKQLRRQASGAQHTHDDAGKLHGGSKLERLNNPSASGERSIAVTGDIHNSVFSTGDIHVHQHDTTRFERCEATVQSEASATRDEVRDGLTRIEQLLRQDQGNATEIELRTRIDVARELYQQGRFSIARTQATKLRESSDLPLKLQLQLSNIIGGSALYLGNPEAAVAELESALDQDPNDATILENAAGANLFTGNFERARDLALRAL